MDEYQQYSAEPKKHYICKIIHTAWSRSYKQQKEKLFFTSQNSAPGGYREETGGSGACGGGGCF